MITTTELYRIIEQKERHIISLERQNKELIVKNIDFQEQLLQTDVSQQRELLIAYEKFASKKMYNDLEKPINKIIDNFLAINCG